MHAWPFYGALALATAVLGWKNADVRPVGLALVASWLGSMASVMWLSPVEQPQAYTICETAVLSMAFFAHVMGAGRAMVAIVAVSMVSIGLNLYMSATDALTRTQVYSWHFAANICFATECLLVAVPALYDRARSGRVARRDMPALHGGATHTRETVR
jgi:hypothetical protein